MVIIVNSFEDTDFEETVGEVEVVEETTPTFDPLTVYNDAGELDPQLLFSACLRAMSLSGEIMAVKSITQRGRVITGDGVELNYIQMQRGGGQIRELLTSGNKRFLRVSDGNLVWNISRGAYIQSHPDEVSCQESDWWVLRVSSVLPLYGDYGKHDMKAGELLDGDYWLELNGPGKLRLRIIVSSETFLIKVVSSASLKHQVKVLVSDYREVGCYMLPFKYSFFHHDDRSFHETMLVESYEFNPGLLPSLFEP
ncbi:hypothetical protein GCM10007047_33590 [Cerasicoccus arenae]|uniref:Uncharacterized protein n=2 Tax=Cerasicoccus arenae TaxID=424488 RepID=A0A8J3GED1_9BACT|nr:hypothetical protein GCM10007047_33590 [Cerasicoccus arenae]